MNRAQEYFANFGEWTIDEYVTKYILSNPSEMERLTAILKIIPEHVSTLLDVGCGPGIFLHLLDRESRIKGIGVEITESKIRYAKETLNVQAIKGDVSCLSFGDQSFDMVTALEVIEHLPYETYEKALEEIQRVAKKWIIISVPYREEKVFIPCPYCGAQFNSSYHMRSFDEKKLKNLLPDFNIAKLERMGSSFHFSKFFRKLASILFKPPFPEFAVCPACGYRNTGYEDVPLRFPRASYLTKILRSGSIFLKWSKRYHYFIASYERARIGKE
jgi:SAM-dependent methyltransferase